MEGGFMDNLGRIRIALLACYADEHGTIVKVSMAITQIVDEETRIIYQEMFHEGLSVDFIQELEELARSYGADLRYPKDPLPLTKCDCCDDYAIAHVSANDLSAEENEADLTLLPGQYGSA
jgi:hypothetical protein